MLGGRVVRGGPYALACAARLPAAKAVLVIAAAAPYRSAGWHGAAGMGEDNLAASGRLWKARAASGLISSNSDRTGKTSPPPTSSAPARTVDSTEHVFALLSASSGWAGPDEKLGATVATGKKAARNAGQQLAKKMTPAGQNGNGAA
ncbi:MAG TPA: hypothetical protein VMF65_07935 [Acidimicrobiales bacterium]|nr:hypothetical protein [Acidimicrobiales bacterium]